MNRILLDVRERRVWAGVNKDVSLTLDDDDPTAGAISLAAFGRGSIPPRFNFDNVLVTEHP